MRPKYSIILPTLNGARTLAVTLPAMLRIDRDDVEFVVSENHSDDGTYELVREIVADDDRVLVVRPSERLPLGRHLEFAYQQAHGRWLSHLGDDDYLLPWRFELLDQVLADTSEECSLIRGEYVRYNWPQFPQPEVANTLDAARFTRALQVVPGVELAATLLNQSHIHGGGAWVVRSDMAQAIRRRSGYFASPQHVEFFAMRAAAALSESVALVGLPLFVLGRHAKSSGTQYFLPKQGQQENSWDWEFEDPEHYQHSPFNWKSYSTLSLDAALKVKATFADELGEIAIDWPRWNRTIHSEMMKLVDYGQLPAAAQRDFLAAVSSTGSGNALSWHWRTWRLAWQAFWRKPKREEHSSEIIASREGIFWTGSLAGEAERFESITEVPAYLDQATHGDVKSLTTNRTPQVLALR